jgi:hypothetical protein
LVAGTEDHDELIHLLENEVVEFPFVVQSTEGIYIPNGQYAYVEAADWLREQPNLDDFTIKATLSRLPDDWPTDR